jgi:hypothetical protein
MDGAKIKENFEKFLSEHPEVVVIKNGRRLTSLDDVAMFCFEYNYHLTYAKRKLRKLGLLGKKAITIWDPNRKVIRNLYALDEADTPEYEIVTKAERIITTSPRIVRKGGIWVYRGYLLPLCEEYKISYFQLLRILRKYGLVKGAGAVYDQENGGYINVVEISCDEQEKQIIENVRKLLREKSFKGRFITYEDLMRIAEDMNTEYRSLIALLKRNGLIIERVIAYRIGRI